MNEAWIPVLFVAVIVFGVVGGTLAQMVLKELLPLLRNMAEQRTRIEPADLEPLRASMQAVERRLAHIESEQRRLVEDGDFVRRLLASPSPGETAARPVGDQATPSTARISPG